VSGRRPGTWPASTSTRKS